MGQSPHSIRTCKQRLGYQRTEGSVHARQNQSLPFCLLDWQLTNRRFRHQQSRTVPNNSKCIKTSSWSQRRQLGTETAAEVPAHPLLGVGLQVITDGSAHLP